MSLFVAGAIAGLSFLAGLLTAFSEQVRAKLRRRREAEPLHAAVAIPPNAATKSTSAASDSAQVSATSRAAAYREILDALGDDLDEDIAEWEAVLQDFPQVIGAEEVRPQEERVNELALEAAQEPTSRLSESREKFNPPLRTRRISDDERGMILRLMKTGFACEEIALWHNLPLERVQELLPRN